jgi:hypothetical protein
MKNSKKIASEKSKFTFWVSFQYKQKLLKENYTGDYERKMNPKINILIRDFIKDIKYYDMTDNDKKKMLFKYFTDVVLEQKKQELKIQLIEDKKFLTTETVNQRKRILSTFTKKPKKRCFYLTNQWLYLKKEVHKLYKCGCMKCGKTEGETHVDHILPRSLHPELQYNIHNLQILCKNCNMKKSNKNNTDYRTELQKHLCNINHP